MSHMIIYCYPSDTFMVYPYITSAHISEDGGVFHARTQSLQKVYQKNLNMSCIPSPSTHLCSMNTIDIAD